MNNNIDLWPQNADKNEDDDDTRSNVNIGLWPDDVGRDKTCRQCIPCSDHTCLLFLLGSKFVPASACPVFHPGQGVPASHIVTGMAQKVTMAFRYDSRENLQI
jgi:hypothetical protein